MKQTYKNKRDFYKANWEAEQGKRLRLERELASLKEAQPAKKKTFEAIIFCEGCLRVIDILCPVGLTPAQGGCPYCGHSTKIHVVNSYPGKS